MPESVVVAPRVAPRIFEGKANALQLAVLVVLVVLVVVFVARLFRRGREGLEVSPAAREMHAQSRDLFSRRGSAATYTEFKSKMPDADAVQYDDVRQLYLRGQLTPGAVQRVM